MPNHVHLLLYLIDDKVNLNTIISNAKRFMAYDIVKRLDAQGNDALLNALASACSEKEKRRVNYIRFSSHPTTQNRFTQLNFYIKS